MIHRARRVPAWVLALSLLGVGLTGCCCPQSCPTTRTDPLREIGIDLRGLTTEHAQQIFLDMTVVRIPEARIASALGADRPSSAAEPEAVSTERAQSLLASWHEDKDVRVVSAPKILALPGQKASVFVGESIRFARTEASSSEDGSLEFAIEEEPGNPVQLGDEIVVVPCVSEDGQRVTLDLVGTWREQKRELAEGELAGMTPAAFERLVREHKLVTTFEMESGSWVVIGNPAWIETDAGRLQQVTLLHAVVIEAREPVGRVLSTP